MITSTDIGKFGRLGNQLWQIAALIGYAHKHNMEFFLPQWFCDYTNKDMSVYFENKLNHKSISTENFYIYNEPHFQYSNIPYHENIILHGYFQSERYWKYCEPLIQRYFTPAKWVVKNLTKKYPVIFNSYTCSIHVRRGDYVGNDYHEICDSEYYSRAIGYITKNTSIRQFAVFSDDGPWCKKNFPSDFIFIEGNSDVEDLFLMSFCSHNIGANSSFSKWASILNRNPGISIFPNRWFADENIIDGDVYSQNDVRL